MGTSFFSGYFQIGGVAKRRLPGEDDLPEYEVARRRAQRSEEQASRSARLVYNIQQQVKDVQHEIDKLRPGTVKPNKKVFYRIVRIF